MNKQKIFSKLLSIVLVMTMFLSNVKIITNTMIEVSAVTGDFFNGDGSEDNPYQISTAEQLNNVRKNLGENTYFKLINDIDLTDFIATNDPTNGWLPIGDYYNNFNGHFDGAGYTISGLWIDRSNDFYVGLFGYTGSDSTIKNLGVEISEEGVSGDNTVGGLVGYNSGTITNSYATGSVSGNRIVGGLSGNNVGSITNSYASGSVSGHTIVGGLVGWNYYGSITSSYATGSVSGRSSYVGGLVGYNYRGNTLTNSYATGRVIGYGKNIGGFVGYNTTDAKITNSYFDKNSTGQTDGVGSGDIDGVTPLTTAQMTGSDILTSNEKMIDLGDAWSKRDTTDKYCYYPELAVFYDDGILDTKTKQDSEVSVRVDRIELRGEIITTPRIDYGTTLSEIEATYEYKISEELTLSGRMDWGDDDKMIPEVSDKKYSGTFIPYDDFYKSDLYKPIKVSVTINVTPKEVSIIGLMAANKEYDGTTDATIDNIETIEGILASDRGYVSIDDTTYTASFEDKNVGENKTVLMNNLSLTGDKANNYVLNSTSLETTATISPRELSIIGITVDSKTYDGTAKATINYQGTLEGLIENEEVTIESLNASFINANVEENKSIEIKANIIGNDSTNYIIVAPSDIRASITPKALTIKPDSNQSKNYGKVDPILTYQVTGMIEGDTIEFMGALGRTIGEEKGTYVINQGSLFSSSSNYSIQFTDGVIFTINAKETTPITGDNRQLVSWIALLVVSFLGIIVTIKKKESIGE